MYCLTPQQLWSNTNELMFNVNEKLIIRRTSDHLVITYDNQQHYTMDTTHLLFDKNDYFNMKYILAILLSSFMDLLYKTIVPRVGQAFAEVKIVNLKKLPIKDINRSSQQPFVEKVDTMLRLTKELLNLKQNFIDELELGKIPKKLQNFEELEFDEFIKEYKKAKEIKFENKSKEIHFKNYWKDYFTDTKRDTLDLKLQIKMVDKEIDKMVYKLYGLSEDEIDIVEKSI